MKKVFQISFLFIFTLSFNCSKSVVEPSWRDIVRNGDIEEGAWAPLEWSVYNPNFSKYICGMDVMTVFSGQKSIKIENLSFTNDIYALYYQYLQAFPRGKFLKFSAYIKTRGVTEGSASLIIGAKNSNGDEIIQTGTYENTVINGTRPWRRYSAMLLVPDEAETVYLYFYHSGSGTAWFDKASLTYNK